MADKEKWTEEDDAKLFQLFKEHGTKWCVIAKKFEHRTENQIKNRFYSTLRRVATKKKREAPLPGLIQDNCKADLLKYVEDAANYGHNCFSKRGRMKKRASAALPKTEAVLPPSLPAPNPIRPNYLATAPGSYFQYSPIPMPCSKQETPSPFLPFFSPMMSANQPFLAHNTATSTGLATYGSKSSQIQAHISELMHLQNNILNLMAQQQLRSMPLLAKTPVLFPTQPYI